MRPVLKQLTIGFHIAYEIAGMGTEPCKNRKLLRARQDIDRIHLKHANAIKHFSNVAAVNVAGRFWRGKPLGGERDSSRLRNRELFQEINRLVSILAL